MPLDFKTFQELVNDQVAAIQGTTEELIDFDTGSIELAQVEANAAMGIWLEYLINATLALARSSTSEGINLDTWMAQFRFTRKAATKASGNVDFTRFTDGSQVEIPVGSLVKTTDFEVEFVVIPDLTNPAYNEASNAYIMASNEVLVSAKVECTTAGIQGNVGANEITFISSPIPGIDNVNNPDPFTNADPEESDASFRARFILYINSLSRAVLAAYANALAAIPQITRFNVVENVSYAGAPQPGYVYTVIDDGTGSPPPSLIAEAEAAIEKVRGLAIQNDVFGAVAEIVDISLDLVITTGSSQTEITALVEEALATYINELGFDKTLPYTKVFEVVYNASGFILNVENLLVNGGTIDLAGDPNNVFVFGTATIGYI